MTDDSRTGVLLDLDGTLVDSVFHHVLAWDEAFRDDGHEVPLWRVHAAVGMGGDRLVPWVLGHGDADAGALAAAEEEAFLRRGGSLRPTNGATALLQDLGARSVPHVIASSSTPRVSEALLAVLGHPEVSSTTGGDVPSTKPSPDPLRVAAATLDLPAHGTTLVGDSVWDAEAAAKAGMRSIAVRCGGVGPSLLLAAGAVDVVDDPRALVGRL